MVISTGNNRYVEELRLNDPDLNPRSSESVTHIGMERPIAMKREPSPANMEMSWSAELTRASQRKIQSNPVNDHSEESVLIEEEELE